MPTATAPPGRGVERSSPVTSGDVAAEADRLSRKGDDHHLIGHDPRPEIRGYRGRAGDPATRVDLGDAAGHAQAPLGEGHQPALRLSGEVTGTWSITRVTASSRITCSIGRDPQVRLEDQVRHAAPSSSSASVGHRSWRARRGRRLVELVLVPGSARRGPRGPARRSPAWSIQASVDLAPSCRANLTPSCAPSDRRRGLEALGGDRRRGCGLGQRGVGSGGLAAAEAVHARSAARRPARQRGPEGPRAPRRSSASYTDAKTITWP